MQSYLILSSESSENSETCPRCQILQEENNKLRSKNEKIQTKYHKIKQDYDELLLKKELLEEQVKLLQATQQSTKTKTEENTISSTQVSKILSDFDTLLDIQGKEIYQLMTDRDKLSNICFSALSVISQQEIYLKRFQNGTQKLIQFMSSSDSSLESVIQDFATLGFDIHSIVSSVQRKMDIQLLVESLNRIDSPPIDPNEVIRIINELPNVNLNGDSLQTVTQFILQQISAQKNLMNEIEEQKMKQHDLKNKLNSILTACKPNTISRNGKTQIPNQNSKFTVKDVINRYLEMQEAVSKVEEIKNLSRKIVQVFEAFGSRFPDNSDTQRCLMRIRFWLENPDSEIDVVQEIDFLLGLCIPSKVPEADEESTSTLSDSTSSISCLMERIGIAKQNLQTSFTHQQIQAPSSFENDMLNQIQSLKQEFSDMKDRIRISNEERRRFICRHMQKHVPLNHRYYKPANMY